MQLSFKVWKEDPNPSNEYYEMTYVSHEGKKPTWTLTNEKGEGNYVCEGTLYEFLSDFFSENKTMGSSDRSHKDPIDVDEFGEIGEDEDTDNHFNNKYYAYPENPMPENIRVKVLHAGKYKFCKKIHPIHQPNHAIELQDFSRILYLNEDFIESWRYIEKEEESNNA